MRMRVMSTNCRDTSAFPDLVTTLAARMTCKADGGGSSERFEHDAHAL